MKKIFTILLSVLFYFSFAQDTARKEFKPSGKIWGLLFGDYFYKMDGDTSQSAGTGKWGDGEFSQLAKDRNAFTVRRAYLGYDYNIAENFAAQFLLEGNDGVTASEGKRTVFIKSAYAEWKKLIPRASIFIGQSATPTWSLVTEKAWGYRSIEKTITDFRKLGKSNDWGIRISGTLDSAGNLGYHAMVGNGTAEKVEFDKYKKVYGSLFLKLLDKKVTLEVYGDYEKTSAQRSIMTLKGFTAFESKYFSAGIEGVQQYKTNYNGDTADVIPMGFAFFARGAIVADKLNFFARADIFNPDVEASVNSYQEYFFTLGLDFMPHRNIHLMPNIWVNAYASKLTTEPNRKADFVPRLTFYYLFR